MKNMHDIMDEYVIIYAKEKGRYDKILIDIDDLELVSSIGGTWQINQKGYAYVTKNQKYIPLHRLIMKPSKDMIVDHIDGNKLNNRKLNLRVITQSENVQNIRRSEKTKSGITGVVWNKQYRRWQVRIEKNKKRIELGYYEDLEEARTVSILARALYHEYSKEHMLYNKVKQKLKIK